SRKLARTPDDQPVVAGPWLGDEVGEVLYWIPFLRWAQAATFGLQERLIVVARPRSEPWYAGIGARRVRPEDVGDAPSAALPASWVEDVRHELAARRPGDR